MEEAAGDTGERVHAWLHAIGLSGCVPPSAQPSCILSHIGVTWPPNRILILKCHNGLFLVGCRWCGCGSGRGTGTSRHSLSKGSNSLTTSLFLQKLGNVSPSHIRALDSHPCIALLPFSGCHRSCMPWPMDTPSNVATNKSPSASSLVDAGLAHAYGLWPIVHVCACVCVCEWITPVTPIVSTVRQRAS